MVFFKALPIDSSTSERDAKYAGMTKEDYEWVRDALKQYRESGRSKLKVSS